MKIYADSSTKEACIVVEGYDPAVYPYSEPVTVNVGEYQAAILALSVCRLISEEVEILTDSLLVVNQVNGLWKCKKPHLLPFRDYARLLMESGATLKWIPREENLAGKVLG